MTFKKLFLPAGITAAAAAAAVHRTQAFILKNLVWENF